MNRRGQPTKISCLTIIPSWILSKRRMILVGFVLFQLYLLSHAPIRNNHRHQNANIIPDHPMTTGITTTRKNKRQTLLRKSNNKLGKTRGFSKLNNPEDNNNEKVLMTGSFANCSSSGIISGAATATEPTTPMVLKPLKELENRSRNSEMTMTMMMIGSGMAVVSCRPLGYRIPWTTFLNLLTTSPLIVGVLSSASNPQRRQVIRSTWAHHHETNKGGVFFVVAGPWKDIEDEFQHYQDLIWINQPEEYEALTYKTAMLFHIVAAATAAITTTATATWTHVLKTDDDSYVALERILAHMDQMKMEGVKDDYWGHCHTLPQTPSRDAKFKWSITESEYPEPYFPSWCQGVGYVASRKFVNCASGRAAHHHHHPIDHVRFMKHEDVFVGMLAERCGITPTRVERDWILNFRSGWRHTNKPEQRRTDHGLGKIPDGPWMPPAEMAGKLIQHRINSDKDIQDHHDSIMQQQNIGLYKVQTGDTVFYYSSEQAKWIQVYVMEKGAPAAGNGNKNAGGVVDIVTVVPVNNGSSSGKFFKVPFRPYMGEWRSLPSKV